MRLIALTIPLLAWFPAMATAGEIYGKITSGGAPAGDGTEVSAKCGGKAYPAVRTDKAGSYHLVIQESGKCTLSIATKGGSASVEVVSYDEAAQVDIALEMKDGKLAARRR
jgi:hypothetical protein